MSFADGVLTAVINGDDYTVSFDESKGCLIINGSNFSYDEFISINAKDVLNGVWKAWLDGKEERKSKHTIVPSPLFTNTKRVTP